MCKCKIHCFKVIRRFAACVCNACGRRLCKRRPFAFQKAVFYTLKGGLLQCERPPFAKSPVSVEIPVPVIKACNAFFHARFRAVSALAADARYVGVSTLHVARLHAFHVHFKESLVHFDVVVDFNLTDISEFRKKATEALENEFPTYRFQYNIDPDYA